MDPIGSALLRAAGLLAGVVILYAPLAWLERWASLAPSERERLGQAPLLPVTHALKLLGKRAPSPPGSDGLIHALAPVLLLVPGLFVLAQIPPAPPLVSAAGELPLAVTGAYGSVSWAIGLLLVQAAGILLAGWSGADNLALLGGLRLSLVRMSALIVVALGAAGVARAHGTDRMAELVAAQGQEVAGWLPALGAFTNPLGFGAAVVALAVLSQRGQRTRPDRNADLVESYAITARGPTLLAHRLFEVVDLLAAAAVVAAVFLGGWLVPGVDRGEGGDVAFVLGRAAAWLVKVLVVAGGLLLVRRALPPLRHDQALRLVWAGLVPVAAAGLLLSSLVTQLLD